MPYQQAKSISELAKLSHQQKLKFSGRKNPLSNEMKELLLNMMAPKEKDRYKVDDVFESEVYKVLLKGKKESILNEALDDDE